MMNYATNKSSSLYLLVHQHIKTANEVSPVTGDSKLEWHIKRHSIIADLAKQGVKHVVFPDKSKMKEPEIRQSAFESTERELSPVPFSLPPEKENVATDIAQRTPGAGTSVHTGEQEKESRKTVKHHDVTLSAGAPIDRPAGKLRSGKAYLGAENIPPDDTTNNGTTPKANATFQEIGNALNNNDMSDPDHRDTGVITLSPSDLIRIYSMSPEVIKEELKKLELQQLQQKVVEYMDKITPKKKDVKPPVIDLIHSSPYHVVDKSIKCKEDWDIFKFHHDMEYRESVANKKDKVTATGIILSWLDPSLQGRGTIAIETGDPKVIWEYYEEYFSRDKERTISNLKTLLNTIVFTREETVYEFTAIFRFLLDLLEELEKIKLSEQDKRDYFRAWFDRVRYMTNELRNTFTIAEMENRSFEWTLTWVEREESRNTEQKLVSGFVRAANESSQPKPKSNSGSYSNRSNKNYPRNETNALENQMETDYSNSNSNSNYNNNPANNNNNYDYRNNGNGDGRGGGRGRRNGRGGRGFSRGPPNGNNNPGRYQQRQSNQPLSQPSNQPSSQPTSQQPYRQTAQNNIPFRAAPTGQPPLQGQTILQNMRVQSKRESETNTCWAAETNMIEKGDSADSDEEKKTPKESKPADIPKPLLLKRVKELLKKQIDAVEWKETIINKGVIHVKEEPSTQSSDKRSAPIEITVPIPAIPLTPIDPIPDEEESSDELEEEFPDEWLKKFPLFKPRDGVYEAPYTKDWAMRMRRSRIEAHRRHLERQNEADDDDEYEYDSADEPIPDAKSVEGSVKSGKESEEEDLQIAIQRSLKDQNSKHVQSLGLYDEFRRHRRTGQFLTQSSSERPYDNGDEATEKSLSRCTVSLYQLEENRI
jgi:hypothetical protein